MQATLAPNSVEFLTETSTAPTSEKPIPFAQANIAQRSFLKEHWELKILFWGLGLIALAYPATYLITYAIAEYWPVSV